MSGSLVDIPCSSGIGRVGLARKADAWVGDPVQYSFVPVDVSTKRDTMSSMDILHMI